MELLEEKFKIKKDTKQASLEKGVSNVTYNLDKNLDESDILNEDFNQIDGDLRNILSLYRGDNEYHLKRLEEEYAGMIKLIYIDPPYNKILAKEVHYKGDRSDYYEFMKKRFILARKLMREDGLIIVHIDHKEVFRIGCIMEDVFGRANAIPMISLQHKGNGTLITKINKLNEFLILFAKNKSKFNFINLSTNGNSHFKYEDEYGEKYMLRDILRTRSGLRALRTNNNNLFYPLFIKKEDTTCISLDEKLEGNDDYLKMLPYDKGNEVTWICIKPKMQSYIDNNRILYLEKRGIPRLRFKGYKKERYRGVLPDTMINNKLFYAERATRAYEKLMGRDRFYFGKSVDLLKWLIKITTGEGDIVLDYFGGSGTTAHGLLEQIYEDGQNRKGIFIERSLYNINLIKERLDKVSDIIKNRKNQKRIFVNDDK